MYSLTILTYVITLITLSFTFTHSYSLISCILMHVLINFIILRVRVAIFNRQPNLEMRLDILQVYFNHTNV